MPDPEDLRTLLESLGLESYLSVLAEEGVDEVETLQELSETDLSTESHTSLLNIINKVCGSVHSLLLELAQKRPKLSVV